jgi:DNA protecting protein DprA
MSELALAVFASETGTHLVKTPRGERWRAFERRFDERASLERLAAAGYRFLSRSSPDFPPLLRAIHDPPPGLFLRGVAKPELLARPAVAVVGARASSGYGASVGRGLGRELAAAGLVVVSGLARGIDAEAHRGALEANGATVAVLGCGIDRDYPAAHAELARRVADAGLIVSEYAPGVEPAPWRFPARKRRNLAAVPNPHGYAVRIRCRGCIRTSGGVSVVSGLTGSGRQRSQLGLIGAAGISHTTLARYVNRGGSTRS